MTSAGGSKLGCSLTVSENRFPGFVDLPARFAARREVSLHRFELIGGSNVPDEIDPVFVGIVALISEPGHMPSPYT